MAENESKPKGNWKKEGWGKKPDTDTMIVTRIPPQNFDSASRCRHLEHSREILLAERSLLHVRQHLAIGFSQCIRADYRSAVEIPRLRSG